MSVDRLEIAFPNLAGSNYRITSPCTPAYNCVAWAAADNARWWDPGEFFYWPAGIPREYTLDAFVAAFRTLGYSVCDDGVMEAGYEKIAIYADERDEPRHMARQQRSGAWTSKLGKWEDIEHELQGLEGQSYGRVTLFMKRRTPQDDTSDIEE
jgi:hypothetical protein